MKHRQKSVLAFAIVSSLLAPTTMNAAAASAGRVHVRNDSISCDANARHYASGRVQRCRLARELLTPAATLPAGTDVTFAETGALYEAVLRTTTNVHGQPLPKDAWLFFDRSGTKVLRFWLKEPIVMQGHTLWNSHDGVGHMLYGNGALRAIWLEKPEVIRGVPCARVLPLGQGWWHSIRLGAQAMTWFFEDGALEQAMLSEDITLQGHAFQRGDVVRFHRDGTIDLMSPKLDWNGWDTHIDEVAVRDSRSVASARAPSEIGTYALQSVAGKAVPASIEEGGRKMEVVSGSIVLGAANAVSVTTAFRMTPGQGAPMSNTVSGTYRLTGDTLTFTFTNGGSSRGILKGTVIESNMTEAGAAWVYKKQ